MNDSNDMIAIEINTIFEGVCGFLMHFNNFFLYKNC